MVTVDFDLNWPRAAWIGFGVLLALAVLFVVHSFVGTFVFGVFIYYATRRLYRRVRCRVRPASLAAGLSLGLLALPALLIVYYTLAIGLQEFENFRDNFDVSEGQLEPILNVIQPYGDLAALAEDPSSLVADGGGLGAITDALDVVLSSIGVVGNGLLHLFVMFALAFYLLRDGPRMARWLGNFTDAYGVLDQYGREVDRSLDKVFYGNILNAIITGTIGAIAFSLLNIPSPEGVAIPYAALVGLLAGVASLIPIVGMKLVYVPMAVYLAVTAGVSEGAWWFVGLFVAVAFVIVDTIPDLVVRPYVSGGTLHVGALMFAYILGPLLWGWYGIFLGPIVLVLVVHFVRIVLPELLAGTPIEPYTVDPSNVMSAPARGPAPAPTGADGGVAPAAEAPAVDGDASSASDVGDPSNGADGTSPLEDDERSNGADGSSPLEDDERSNGADGSSTSGNDERSNGADGSSTSEDDETRE